MSLKIPQQLDLSLPKKTKVAKTKALSTTNENTPAMVIEEPQVPTITPRQNVIMEGLPELNLLEKTKTENFFIVIQKILFNILKWKI